MSEKTEQQYNTYRQSSELQECSSGIATNVALSCAVLGRFNMACEGIVRKACC